MRRNDSAGRDRSYFRSDQRTFRLNGEWYFATREGDIGPFKTRDEAEREVRRYTVELRDLDGFQHSREERESTAAGARARPYSMTLVPIEDAALSFDADL